MMRSQLRLFCYTGAGIHVIDIVMWLIDKILYQSLAMHLEMVSFLKI